MNEKVTLSNEVASAIESVRLSYGEALAITNHAREGWTWTFERKSLNGLSLDTFIRALYVGHETEETLHDKLRRRFEYLTQIIRTDKSRRAADEIIMTLDTIGMNVKGMNA